MRLWSLHPQYLDRAGLVACWREALLAQVVLRGRTIGYRRHPQLLRFREAPSPRAAIADYLRGVNAEGVRRGYTFDARKIGRARGAELIAVTDGQLLHEWQHLLAKLAVRAPEWHARLRAVRHPQPHPLFRVVSGGVEAWEKLHDLIPRAPSRSSGRKRP